jgi:hypothetical protein
MQEPSTTQPQSTPPPSAPDGLRALRDAIGRLRSAIKAQLLVSRLGMIAAAYVGAMLLGGLADYLLRFPSGLRVVAFLLAAGLLACLAWRVVYPVLRFRPNDTDLALRLEQTEMGEQRGWNGVLASGLELSTANQDQTLHGDPRLASIASDLAGERFNSARVQVLKLMDPSDLRRGLLCAALAAACVLGLSFATPELLRIGTRRVLLPWTDTPWPKRTGVLMAAQPVAHPLGMALPMRAILTKSSRSAEDTRVSVRYRLIVDGDEVASQTALMTPQGKRASFDPGLGGRAIEGDLFERLLDVQDLLPEALAANRAEHDIKLEYWFETSDDATARWRTVMVEPPAVASMRVTVQPPAYLERLGDSLGASVLRGDVEAGNGLDNRADVGPVLAGSRVSAAITLNKPIPVEPSYRPGWLESTLPGLAGLATIERTIGEREWRLGFTPQASVRTAIRPRDQFGIESRDEASLRIEVMEDRPPTAAVIDPPQDESVLPNAVLALAAEGRDDVAIWRAALRTQVAKMPTDVASAGAVPAAQGEPAALAAVSRERSEDAGAFADPRVVRAGATIDLAPLTLSPGDEVWLTAATMDARGALSGERTDAATAEAPGAFAADVISPARRLRIISESQLVEQIRAELTGLRDAARRLEQDQRALGAQRDQATNAGDTRESQEAAAGEAQRQSQQQSNIRDRLRPVEDNLQRLAKRAERNNLSDTALTGLLSDARETAEAAGEQAQTAGEALRELSTQRDQQAREQAAEAAEKSQGEAQQELEALADMLDQGNDDWTVRRQLEQLLSDQKQLRSQTGATGAETAGQEQNELTQRQRDDLERLARRQQELSQRATQALDAAQARAEQMSEANPAQAQAIREAAQRARARQLSQRQQQASEQIRQNQTGGAQQSQRQAEQAIEEALEALDDVRKAQDEQLRRVLADIMQSLEQLIAQQQAELDRLAKAIEGEAMTGLDRAMIALQQNTLGVLSKARKDAPDATRLAELIESAGDAQAGAIVALRANPIDLASAEPQERTSLQRLRDALEEAKKQDEDAQNRDDERVRRELRRAYAEALEEQTILRADAQPLLDVEPSRRTRSQARGIGDKQAQLRDKLEQLRSKTQELQDAKLFDFAHTRLDRAMAGAAQTLRDGAFGRAADRQQATAIATLRSLLDALKEQDKKDDGLRGQSGGGGSGQSGPSKAIPDAAELILLRGLQAEAADRTRALGDGVDADAAELEDVARLQEELAAEARGLLERLQQQAPPGVAPGPKQPTDDGGDAPKPDGGPATAPGQRPGRASEEPNADAPRTDDGGKPAPQEQPK